MNYLVRVILVLVLLLGSILPGFGKTHNHNNKNANKEAICDIQQVIPVGDYLYSSMIQHFTWLRVVNKTHKTDPKTAWLIFSSHTGNEVLGRGIFGDTYDGAKVTWTMTRRVSRASPGLALGKRLL